MDQLTDEQLLALYVSERGTRERREGAFRELVDRYERRVWAICLRTLGSATEAEEAMQDTFIRIARGAATFRGDSRLSTWVHRVAISACQDLLRKAARRPQTPVEDVAEAAATSGLEAGPDEADGAVTRDEVRRALATLDETSRMIVVLCAIEGHAYAEVAEMLAIPVGTVKSRLFRARARLAELLSDAVEPSGPAERPTT